MANHKSAIKRARQNEIRRLRNRTAKTRIKSAIKKVEAAVAENNSDILASQLDHAKSVIDNAARRGIIHKRTAARKVSRLAKLSRTLSA
ncbi:MAG: 30S ribosomal protein S20 [Desulfobacterales bacterium]